MKGRSLQPKEKYIFFHGLVRHYYLERLAFCALKAHRQISQKRCFKKYCSCDQA